MNQGLTLTVDSSRCRGDGLCARVCPMRIFSAGGSGTLALVTNQERCVLCGQCVAICPHDAIRHSALNRDRFVPIAGRAIQDAEAFVAGLKERRSVRVYADRPVPRELLERFVDVAGFAPGSAHGGEGWTRSVAIVTGRPAMEQVRALTAGYLEILHRTLTGWVPRVFSRFNEELQGGLAMLPDIAMRLAEHRAGRDAIVYGAPAAVFVHAPRTTPEAGAHCHAPMTAILFAAHAHGLGACWNGYLAKAASGSHAKSFRALREWLAIPDHHDCYAAATIGWPVYRLHSLPHRETRVHWVD
jgi:NAD-dependent dihydropyrimidine dehydrogenase PreA subunit/nitroreductase